MATLTTVPTGEALHAARLSRGLRVGQLARLAGLSRVTIWRAENGHHVAERTGSPSRTP